MLNQSQPSDNIKLLDFTVSRKIFGSYDHGQADCHIWPVFTISTDTDTDN